MLVLVLKDCRGAQFGPSTNLMQPSGLCDTENRIKHFQLILIYAFIFVISDITEPSLPVRVL